MGWVIEGAQPSESVPLCERGLDGLFLHLGALIICPFLLSLKRLLNFVHHFGSCKVL